jgi:hypothetical protein
MVRKQAVVLAFFPIFRVAVRHIGVNSNGAWTIAEQLEYGMVRKQ